MQNGRIYRKGSAWILSYAVKAQEPDGKITWARRSKRLAPYGDEYRTEASVIWRVQAVLSGGPKPPEKLSHTIICVAQVVALFGCQTRPTRPFCPSIRS